MIGFDDILSIAEIMLSTRTKRHILSGVFISAALLFGGLAFTITTMYDESEEDEDEDGR